MLDLTQVPGTNVLHLTIDGDVSEDDFDRVVRQLEAAVDKEDGIRVLEEVRDIGEIPPNKLWEDARFAFRHLDDLERAAVVAPDKWIEIFSKAADPFVDCEVRYFHPDDIDDAWSWIKS